MRVWGGWGGVSLGFLFVLVVVVWFFLFGVFFNVEVCCCSRLSLGYCRHSKA